MSEITLPTEPALRDPEYFKLYNDFADTFGFHKVVSGVKTFFCDWPRELEKRNIISLSPEWKRAIETTRNSYLDPATKVTLITKFTNTIQNLKNSTTSLDRWKNLFALVSDVGNIMRLASAAKIVVLKSGALKTIGLGADGFHVVEDCLDLKKTLNFLKESEVFELENATVGGNFRNAINALENQTYAWIKIAKSVSSIAAGILGVAALVVGTQVISPIVLLSITSVSLICSLWSHFYRETMTENLRISPEVQTA